MAPLLPDPDRRLAGRLSAAFAGLLVAIVGLMTLGALVRAHEAGLACPDWPLCFGEVVPRFDVKVAFEWSHRALAGGISLIFAGLAVVVWRRPALAPLRPFLVTTALVLGVQILLGALTVWQLLASWTVTSHLVTGNAFAISILLVVLRLRELGGVAPPPARVSGGAGVLLALVAASLGLQIVLGGLVSSTFAGLACPEWPACNGGHYFPSWRGSVGLHLLHRSNAYLLLGLLGASAWVLRGTALGHLAAGLALLGLAQVAVGVANVLLGLPVEVTGLHSLLAAVLVLGTTAALWRAFRDSA